MYYFHLLNSSNNTITNKITKFPEFLQEIKNSRLHLKIDNAPFKVLPIDCNALAFYSILELFFIFGLRYGLQCFHDLILGAETRNAERILESIE